jgi:Domain of unknown function (DUF1707)
VRYAGRVARVPSLRASDADREQVAERLRQATVEGRLSADELEGRLDALYSARTYGQLDVLVADLPAPRSGRHGRLPVPLWAGAAAAVALMFALFGMLAGLARHSAAVAVVPHPSAQTRFAGPFAGAPHRFVVGAPVVGVLAVVVVCAALVLWSARHSRGTSDA